MFDIYLRRNNSEQSETVKLDRDQMTDGDSVTNSGHDVTILSAASIEITCREESHRVTLYRVFSWATVMLVTL